jgi:hypothetical protein
MLGMSDGDAADLVIDYGALADNLEVERKHLFASFNVSGYRAPSPWNSGRRTKFQARTKARKLRAAQDRDLAALLAIHRSRTVAGMAADTVLNDPATGKAPVSTKTAFGSYGQVRSRRHLVLLGHRRRAGKRHQRAIRLIKPTPEPPPCTVQPSRPRHRHGVVR